MARKATGQVVERDGKHGRVYALRFRAYGQRHYVTVGSAEEGWDRRRAEVELQNVMADVRRGTWRPADPDPVVEVRREPTFHEFASEWMDGVRPELRPRTAEDYEWALTHHLLPFFAGHRLTSITIAEVDRYRHWKVREGKLSPGTLNKTITRLAQVLELAVEYGHLSANPARGRRRRVKTGRPRRAWLEPEQVRPLLDAAGKHRPLLATAVLAGPRIGELLALLWRDVDLASSRLRVREAKTDAGVREVDLSPALREELVAHKLASPFSGPTDLVSHGRGEAAEPA